MWIKLTLCDMYSKQVPTLFNMDLIENISATDDGGSRLERKDEQGHYNVTESFEEIEAILRNSRL